jgi:hypothetical protein
LSQTLPPVVMEISILKHTPRPGSFPSERKKKLQRRQGIIPICAVCPPINMVK